MDGWMDRRECNVTAQGERYIVDTAAAHKGVRPIGAMVLICGTIFAILHFTGVCHMLEMCVRIARLPRATTSPSGEQHV